MVFVLDILSLAAIFILWFLMAAYVAVIRKYRYEKEYAYFWDLFKMWYVCALYVFIGISVYRCIVLFSVNAVYSVVFIAFLAAILFGVSFFLLLRTAFQFQKAKWSRCFLQKFKITTRTLQKTIVLTSAFVLAYSIFACIMWCL